MAHTVDENGFVYIKDNPISKSGVFQYLGSQISTELLPDKIYNVWRPDEELNNPETIKSFELIPWIPVHEMLGDRGTSAEEVGVQGVIGSDVYFRDGTLFSDLKLFGDNLKESIKNGLKELSCGFGCLWKIASGISPNGESYDVIQTRIRGNHLASVQNGRMGSEVAVAMDRASIALDNLNINNQQNGENMDLKEALAEIEKLKKQLADVNKSAKDEDEKKADEKKADSDKSGMDESILSDISASIDAISDKVSDLYKTVDTQSAQIKTMQSSALDANTIVKSISEKNDLAERSFSLVGKFDHSEMDKNAVAKYAIDKLGLACDSGLEAATLQGYLAAQNKPSYSIDHGQDSAIEDKHSEKLGL